MLIVDVIPDMYILLIGTELNVYKDCQSCSLVFY